MKVGREKTLDERSDKYWTKHYRSGKIDVRLVLTGRDITYGRREGETATRVPYYTRMEKLFLTELNDLTQHRAYLAPNFPNVKRPHHRGAAAKKPCFVSGCTKFVYSFNLLSLIW